MKKIGLGIAVLLFAIVLALCSAGIEWVVLCVGMIGLILSVLGCLEKAN